DKLQHGTSSNSSSLSKSNSTSSSQSNSECGSDDTEDHPKRTHSKSYQSSTRGKLKHKHQHPKKHQHNHKEKHHRHHETKKNHSQQNKDNQKNKDRSNSAWKSGSSSSCSSHQHSHSNSHIQGSQSHKYHRDDKKKSKTNRYHKTQKKNAKTDSEKRSESSNSSIKRHSSEEWGMKIPEIYERQFKSTSSQVHSRKSHGSTTSSYSRSSRGSRSSRSMRSSFASGHEPRYLGAAMAPALTILARAIMSDNKHQGYQVTSYFNPKASEPRIQLVAVPLGHKSPWKFCADAALTKHHKALALLRWGQECQDYKISAKASTGLLSGNSAAQLQIKWEHVPTWMKRAAHRAMEFAPGMALMLGFSEKEKKSTPHQLVLRVAAASPRTIDTIVKTPRVIFYFEGVPVPFDLPLDLKPFHKPSHQTRWNFLKQITKHLQNKHSVECEVNEQRFTTFDKRSMKCSLASTSCYCILAQDCTDHLRFLIAMKKIAHPSATHSVNVKLGSSDIKIQPANTEGLQVLFNGMLIMLYNKTYENLRDHITISRQGSMVIVEAPNHGLDRLSFNGETAKVSIASWMRGKTCGICGNADGQRQNDLTKPNHEKALSCSNFIHSWSVPENSCSGGCNFNHQFVKLDTRLYHEEDTTCYSVEPVLQCLNGCVPLKKFPVKVGFHCLP
ncbi:hypothetical protein NDU88_003321, partial [Pleurodeles waltl]